MVEVKRNFSRVDVVGMVVARAKSRLKARYGYVINDRSAISDTVKKAVASTIRNGERWGWTVLVDPVLTDRITCYLMETHGRFSLYGSFEYWKNNGRAVRAGESSAGRDEVGNHVFAWWQTVARSTANWCSEKCSLYDSGDFDWLISAEDDDYIRGQAGEAW